MLNFLKISRNTILLIFMYVNLSANENLKSLNDLYLGGVLSEENYFESLENMGIDTSNQIFKNLYKLFNNKVLDVIAYSDSLLNIMSIKTEKNDKNNDVRILEIEKTINKKYTFTNCLGDGELCNSLKKITLELKYENEKVIWGNEFKDEILKAPEISHIILEDYVLKENKYRSTLRLYLSIKGLIADFVIEGTTTDQSFTADKINGLVSGKNLFYAKLDEI